MGEKTEKKVSYKGYDNIVLDNKDDILYYRALQEFELNQALMLGAYNQDGVYVLADDIKSELVALDKEIGEAAPNVYYASAKAGEYTIKFVVEVEPDQDKLVARLFLLEDCNIQDVIQKKFKTLVASFADKNDVNFLFNMKKAFNLYAGIEAKGRDMSNAFKCLKILELKKKRKHLKETKTLEMNEADKEYVKRMLIMLKKNGNKDLLLLFLAVIRSKNLSLQSKRFILLRYLLDTYLFSGMAQNVFTEAMLAHMRLERMRVYNKNLALMSALKNEKAATKAKKSSAAKAKGKKKKAGAKKSKKAVVKKKKFDLSPLKFPKQEQQKPLTQKPREKKFNSLNSDLNNIERRKNDLSTNPLPNANNIDRTM